MSGWKRKSIRNESCLAFAHGEAFLGSRAGAVDCYGKGWKLGIEVINETNHGSHLALLFMLIPTFIWLGELPVSAHGPPSNEFQHKGQYMTKCVTHLKLKVIKL
jgi:hypothetical protein